MLVVHFAHCIFIRLVVAFLFLRDELHWCNRAVSGLTWLHTYSVVFAGSFGASDVASWALAIHVWSYRINECGAPSFPAETHIIKLILHFRAFHTYRITRLPPASLVLTSIVKVIFIIVFAWCLSFRLSFDVIIIFFHSHNNLRCLEAQVAVKLVYQTSLLNSRPFPHE